MRANKAILQSGPLAKNGRTKGPRSFSDQKSDHLRTKEAKNRLKSNGPAIGPLWSGPVKSPCFGLVRSGGVSIDTPDGPPDHRTNQMNQDWRS